ncbi:MAG: hypothetical protein FJ278_03655, partial [Planctomycetes bacterium]|nr:hypothetical protein [Planctomycetota bacterium]
SKAHVHPPEPDAQGAYSQPPLITLSHDMQYFASGGLQGTYFKSPDFTDPLLIRTDATINFDEGGPASTKAVPSAQSARWEGWLKVDTTQTCELEAVTTVLPEQKAAANLWVNDELVLDAAKREHIWSVKKEVLLTPGYHKVRLEYINPSGYAWWLQLFWWRPDRPWRELIPAAQLYSLRSRATLYYRWDDGKPQEYKAPFKAPAGKHTLHYFAQDETGQREPEKKLELVVAEPKPEAAPAPK